MWSLFLSFQAAAHWEPKSATCSTKELLIQKLDKNTPSMASWEPVLFPNFLNAELLWAITPCKKRHVQFSECIWSLCGNGGVVSMSSLPNVPIRSANPPTGRRQVPVTNCNSRIRFSLSISLMNCKGEYRTLQSFNITSMTYSQKNNP